MTFRETVESGVGWYNRTEQFDQLGVDVLDNTPEEATALVQEMDARLRGAWETNNEAEELHQRFIDIFQIDEAPGPLVTRAELETDPIRKWKWQKTVENEEIQRLLQVQFPAEKWGRIKTRVGATFMREHAELLA